MKKINKLEKLLYSLTQNMLPAVDCDLFPINKYIAFFFEDNMMQVSAETKKSQTVVYISISNDLDSDQNFNYVFPVETVENFLSMCTLEDHTHRVFDYKKKGLVQKNISDSTLDKIYDNFIKKITQCDNIALKALAMHINLEETLKKSENKKRLKI